MDEDDERIEERLQIVLEDLADEEGELDVDEDEL